MHTQKSVMVLRETLIIVFRLTNIAPVTVRSLFTNESLLSTHRFDESSSDKEILDLLLEKKRYDKRLLPPVNGKKFPTVFLVASLFELS